MKRLKTHNSLFLAGIFLLATSCFEDGVELTDPHKYDRALNLAGPIGNINLSTVSLLKQLGSDSYIIVDDEGLLHVQVDTSITATWEDVISINDLTTSRTYDINPNKKAPVGPFYDTIVVNVFSLGEDNQRFDRLLVETGQLGISVILPNNFEGSYTITIPEITNPAGESVVLPTRNFNDASPIDPIDIANDSIVFNNADGKSFITIVTEVDVTNVTGSPANTQMQVDVNITGFKPAYVEGYFGKMNVLEQTREQRFDFFKDFNFADMVQFQEISLELNIENYFGIPLTLNIDSLVFENTQSGQIEHISIDGNSIEVERAFAPDEPSTNQLLINNNNSNLIDGINLGPDRVFMAFIGQSNPAGETAQPNFINTNTQVRAEILIDLPFWFKTSLYERTDTISFDVVGLFKDSAQVDMVEEINLDLTFDNGFPFNIQSQFIMVNDNGFEIDSLFNQDGGLFIWESGQMDSQGKVIAPTSTKIQLRIDKALTKKLYDNESSRIHIRSRISSGDKENPDFVRLYDYYTIKGSMKFEVKSSDLSY
ncbi:MAG: hypothetical protein CVU09_15140 [Bacteroidetes bacterium HGW-Bacteroidetes-4]|jgi:hypothetical protein|nr:MAG: hypothetical protein CVU09_15140 [Bacteroidetes bacterium HGW-Bacteroidetes-4]